MKTFLCRCNYDSLEVFRVCENLEDARDWYINTYCFGRSLEWVQIFELVYSFDF